jgi:hypothetical protein
MVVATGRRRLRRPSGEPPPLPRPPSWQRWLPVAIAVVVLGFLLYSRMEDYRPLAIDVRWLTKAEAWRSLFLVDLARAVNLLATVWAVLLLRGLTLAILAVFRRWRHAIVALLAWAVVDIVSTQLVVKLPSPTNLPPPISVLFQPTAHGHPYYQFPGAAMLALSVTLFSMAYVLAPAGRPRRLALAGAWVLLALTWLSRILLAAVYPVAGLYAIFLSAAVTYVVFEWLTPDEAFPVTYRRGGTAAHLDLAGARAEAVKRAMGDQLGIEIVDVVAFGDEGSGGSTPLLMTTAKGPQLFGKILARSHVRADRWYRMGRSILYGQLEDETRFTSVRRLIIYEDYALRLLDDDGIRVARTYGVVELTPNREYLLPTEFFADSQTLGHADVDDAIIDEGMTLVRKLWDAGLAHRDIKPANLLVVDGYLQLIDVAGLEVRPSPWRQAVDLANMMLVMALRSDAERVYVIAQRYFTPDEIGEAFACAVGMAVPTELQRHLKEDGRDLMGAFQRLAPPFPPVSIQRWSWRRVGLTAAAAVGALVVAASIVGAFRAGVAA